MTSFPPAMPLPDVIVTVAAEVHVQPARIPDTKALSRGSTES
jgi:hypothetical protein